MILAFSICWLPFGCVYTIPLFGIEEKETTNSTTSNKVFPLLTVKFGCAIINPLVYGYENSKVNMIAFIFVCTGMDYFIIITCLINLEMIKTKFYIYKFYGKDENNSLESDDAKEKLLTTINLTNRRGTI